MAQVKASTGPSKVWGKLQLEVARIYALGIQNFLIAYSIVMHLRHFAYSKNELNAVAADVVRQINPDILPGFTVYLLVTRKLLLFPLFDQMIPN